MYIKVVPVLMLGLLSTGLALNCESCVSVDYSKTNLNIEQKRQEAKRMDGLLHGMHRTLLVIIFILNRT